MMTDYSIQDLKDDIDLIEVLEECGFRLVNGGWRANEVPAFCGFHVNVNTPAASVNTLKGVFKCYSCDAGGTIIDAALLHLGTTSISEACKWLQEEFILD